MWYRGSNDDSWRGKWQFFTQMLATKSGRAGLRDRKGKNCHEALCWSGRGEFAGNAVPLRQDAFQIVPPLLLTPSCGGPSADLGEKREPRETVSDNWRKANE